MSLIHQLFWSHCVSHEGSTASASSPPYIFWTIFHCDVFCYLDVVRPSLPNSIISSKWKWKGFCRAASDSIDLLLLSEWLCYNLFPVSQLTSSVASQIPYHLCCTRVTILTWQDLLCLRGPGNLCRLCSSRIFSCSMAGVLLAGKKAYSSRAPSASTPCATGVVLTEGLVQWENIT